jgi:hypothetical protein
MTLLNFKNSQLIECIHFSISFFNFTTPLGFSVKSYQNFQNTHIYIYNNQKSGDSIL